MTQDSAKETVQKLITAFIKKRESDEHYMNEARMSEKEWEELHGRGFGQPPTPDVLAKKIGGFLTGNLARIAGKAAGTIVDPGEKLGNYIEPTRDLSEDIIKHGDSLAKLYEIFKKTIPNFTPSNYSGELTSEDFLKTWEESLPPEQRAGLVAEQKAAGKQVQNTGSALYFQIMNSNQDGIENFISTPYQNATNALRYDIPASYASVKVFGEDLTDKSRHTLISFDTNKDKRLNGKELLAAMNEIRTKPEILGALREIASNDVDYFDDSPGDPKTISAYDVLISLNRQGIKYNGDKIGWKETDSVPILPQAQANKPPANPQEKSNSR